MRALCPHFVDLYKQVSSNPRIRFTLRTNYLPNDKDLTPSEAYLFFCNSGRGSSFYVEKIGPLTHIILEVNHVRDSHLGLKHRIEL